jgi:hypothetical protein
MTILLAAIYHHYHPPPHHHHCHILTTITITTTNTHITLPINQMLGMVPNTHLPCGRQIALFAFLGAEHPMLPGHGTWYPGLSDVGGLDRMLCPWLHERIHCNQQGLSQSL